MQILERKETDDDRGHDETTTVTRMIMREHIGGDSGGACSSRNMCLASDMPPELNMLFVTVVISERGKGGKIAEEDQVL